MKNIYNIIKTVSITEKSNAMMENNQYTFIVDKKSTKYDIRMAVQKVFERKVKSVNVLNRMGKTKRSKFGIGKRSDFKKAIVTLKDGESAIDMF